jgi:hypothetical protein
VRTTRIICGHLIPQSAKFHGATSSSQRGLATRASGGGPKRLPASASVRSRRTDLRNLYQCLVWLACWRATEEFRMSGPDRLISRDDTASALDKQGLILRIIVVAFLAALFWHTVVAAALP